MEGNIALDPDATKIIGQLDAAKPNERRVYLAIAAGFGVLVAIEVVPQIISCITSISVEEMSQFLLHISAGVGGSLAGISVYVFDLLAITILAQESILIDGQRLNAKFSRLGQQFADIQSRDNIITPPHDGYRVALLADVRVPDTIPFWWRETFEEDFDPQKISGCTMLFWPSLDDVVNSQKYLQYLFSSKGSGIFRVIVTHEPKSWEGLRVYLELSDMADVDTYIVPYKWWLGLRRGVEKLNFLDHLEKHVEFVTNGELSQFKMGEEAPADKWFIRFLESDGEPGMGDQRAALAEGSIASVASGDPIVGRQKYLWTECTVELMRYIGSELTNARLLKENPEKLFERVLPLGLMAKVRELSLKCP